MQITTKLASLKLFNLLHVFLIVFSNKHSRRVGNLFKKLFFLIICWLCLFTAFSQDCMVSTLAGNGMEGFMDGTGGSNGTAKFDDPNDVAVDQQGNIYIADRSNNRIRKIATNGDVTTLAGNGIAGFMDGTGGPNGTASFFAPVGIAVDEFGNVIVADQSNHRIRKITPNGDVTTIAGNGVGYLDGLASTARFSGPTGVALDNEGNIYVADRSNNRIRKINSDGIVSTVAGNGIEGYMDGTGGANGTAKFYNPFGLTVDNQGYVYVTDHFNGRIRKITPNGDVTTLAGDGTFGYLDGTGGPNGTAKFNNPLGITVDNQGYVYIGDQANHRIRKITPNGDVTTMAGTGNQGFIDGACGLTETTEFNSPFGITIDSCGQLYVADWGNNRIRKITLSSYEISNITVSNVSDCNSSGVFSTYTADVTVTFTNPPTTGNILLNGDGLATVAVGNLNSSTSHTFTGVSMNPNGQPINLTATFSANTNCTLTNTNAGTAPSDCACDLEVSTLAGNGIHGFMDGTGGPNGTAQFKYPTGTAIDAIGNVYVADRNNHRIRKITPNGMVYTLAGNGNIAFMDGTGGPNGTAQFYYPEGVAVDAQNNVYVADKSHHRIRKIAPNGMTSTLAGNGTPGYADGTGGFNGTAMFSSPSGVTVDAQNNVYVADQLNNRIRKITPDGTVTTLAGSGTLGYLDGSSDVAQFSNPYGVTVDLQGNVYVADIENNRIRKITPDGTVMTLAGSGTSGYMDGTGGPNGTAQFLKPTGVAVDGQNNVYVAGFLNNRIRKIAPGGTVTTLAGSGIDGFMDAPVDAAQFHDPFGIAVDVQGNIFIADAQNNRIRKIACASCSDCSDVQSTLSFTMLGTSNDSCNYQIDITQSELYCIDSIKIEWTSNSGFDSIMIDSTLLIPLLMRVTGDTYNVQTYIYLEDGSICQDTRQVTCEGCSDCSDIQAALNFTTLGTSNDSCNYQIDFTQSELYCIDSIKTRWIDNNGFDSTFIDSTLLTPLPIRMSAGTYYVYSTIFLDDGTVCYAYNQITCEGCGDCNNIQNDLTFTRTSTSLDSCDYQVGMNQLELYCIDSIKTRWYSNNGLDSTFIDSTLLIPLSIRMAAGTYYVYSTIFLDDGTVCYTYNQITCEGCGDCNNIQNDLTFTRISTSLDSCDYQVGINQLELYCIDSIKTRWYSNNGLDSTFIDSTLLTPLSVRMAAGTYYVSSTIFLDDGTVCYTYNQITCEGCGDCNNIQNDLTFTRTSTSLDSCDYQVGMNQLELYCIDSIKTRWIDNNGFDSTFIDSTLLTPLSIRMSAGTYTVYSSIFLEDSSICQDTRQVTCTGCTDCSEVQIALKFTTLSTDNDSCNYQVGILQPELYCIDSIKTQWTSNSGFDSTMIDSTLLIPLLMRVAADTYNIQTYIYLEDGSICQDTRQVICVGCTDCSEMQTALKFTTLGTDNDSCNYQVGILQPELYCIDSIKTQWTSNSGFDSTMIDSTLLMPFLMRMPCDTYSVKSTVFLEDGTSCQYCKEVICESCCDCSNVDGAIIITKLSETTDSCRYEIKVSPSSLNCIDSIIIDWSADIGFDSIILDSIMLSPLQITVPCANYTVQSSVFLKNGTTCNQNQMLACEVCSACNETITIPATLFGVHDTTALNNIIASSIIENGATVTFQAGEAIILNPGFHAKAGSDFAISIVNSPNCSTENNIQEKEDLSSKKIITQPAIIDEVTNIHKIPKAALKIAPNPFSNQTIITYFISEATNLQLKLYDMNGRLLEKIEAGNKEKGWHQINYQAKGLSPGVYYFVLQTAKSLIPNKVIIH